MGLSTTVARPPEAGGAPISDAVAERAAAWLTRCMEGELSGAEYARWQHWRSSHPDHERAWQHIEAVSARLRGLHGGAACHSLAALDGAPAPARRIALAAIAGLGVAVAGGVLGQRTLAWQELAADYRTGTGEQRAIALADGSRIVLNTGSAIDVRYSAKRRLVRLLSGEIHIVTGHAGAAGRPFIVETGEGVVRALGTRFTVRQLNGRTRVDVFDSAVEITPADAPATWAILRQGERRSFTRGDAGRTCPAADEALAWTRGQLTADNVRLGDFLEELGRYRTGVLRCDQSVADLRFSGVFPLRDTDQILAILPNSLPVRVDRRTRYWVTVGPVR